FTHTGPDPAGPAVLVARLSPEKDVANLLEAVAILVRLGGSLALPDFRLEIAGDGPCRGDLEALAGRLGVFGQGRFLGVVGGASSACSTSAAWSRSTRQCTAHERRDRRWRRVLSAHVGQAVADAEPDPASGPAASADLRRSQSGPRPRREPPRRRFPVRPGH